MGANELSKVCEKAFDAITSRLANFRNVITGTPINYIQLREAAGIEETKQAASVLDNWFNTFDIPFAEHQLRFINLCRAREKLNRGTVLSWFASPKSEANLLYWEVAIDLFKPTSFAQLVPILIPSVTRTLNIDTDDKGFCLCSTEGKIEVAEDANKITSTEIFERFVVADGVLFDLHELAEIPLEELAKVVTLIRRDYPNLYEEIARRRATTSQMLLDVDLMSGKTCADALTDLIKDLRHGGEGHHGEFASPTSMMALVNFARFSETLPAEPNETRDQLYALRANFLGDDKSIAQVLKRLAERDFGDCVETASDYFKVILADKKNRTVLQQSASMSAQQRADACARYGREKIKLDGKDEVQIIPTPYVEGLLSGYRLRVVSDLLNLLIDITHPQYELFLKHMTFGVKDANGKLNEATIALANAVAISFKENFITTLQLVAYFKFLVARADRFGGLKAIFDFAMKSVRVENSYELFSQIPEFRPLLDQEFKQASQKQVTTDAEVERLAILLSSFEPDSRLEKISKQYVMNVMRTQKPELAHQLLIPLTDAQRLAVATAEFPDKSPHLLWLAERHADQMQSFIELIAPDDRAQLLRQIYISPRSDKPEKVIQGLEVRGFRYVALVRSLLPEAVRNEFLDTKRMLLNCVEDRIALIKHFSLAVLPARMKEAQVDFFARIDGRTVELFKENQFSLAVRLAVYKDHHQTSLSKKNSSIALTPLEFATQTITPAEAPAVAAAMPEWTDQATNTQLWQTHLQQSDWHSLIVFSNFYDAQARFNLLVKTGKPSVMSLALEEKRYDDFLHFLAAISPMHRAQALQATHFAGKSVLLQLLAAGSHKQIRALFDLLTSSEISALFFENVKVDGTTQPVGSHIAAQGYATYRAVENLLPVHNTFPAALNAPMVLKRVDDLLLAMEEHADEFDSFFNRAKWQWSGTLSRALAVAFRHERVSDEKRVRFARYLYQHPQVIGTFDSTVAFIATMVNESGLQQFFADFSQGKPLDEAFYESLQRQKLWRAFGAAMSLKPAAQQVSAVTRTQTNQPSLLQRAANEPDPGTALAALIKDMKTGDRAAMLSPVHFGGVSPILKLFEAKRVSQIDELMAVLTPEEISQVLQQPVVVKKKTKPLVAHLASGGFTSYSGLLPSFNRGLAKGKFNAAALKGVALRSIDDYKNAFKTLPAEEFEDFFCTADVHYRPVTGNRYVDGVDGHDIGNFEHFCVFIHEMLGGSEDKVKALLLMMLYHPNKIATMGDTFRLMIYALANVTGPIMSASPAGCAETLPWHFSHLLDLPGGTLPFRQQALADALVRKDKLMFEAFSYPSIPEPMGADVFDGFTVNGQIPVAYCLNVRSYEMATILLKRLPISKRLEHLREVPEPNEKLSAKQRRPAIEILVERYMEPASKRESQFNPGTIFECLQWSEMKGLLQTYPQLRAEVFNVNKICWLSLQALWEQKDVSSVPPDALAEIYRCYPSDAFDHMHQKGTLKKDFGTLLNPENSLMKNIFCVLNDSPRGIQTMLPAPAPVAATGLLSWMSQSRPQPQLGPRMPLQQLGVAMNTLSGLASDKNYCAMKQALKDGFMKLVSDSNVPVDDRLRGLSALMFCHQLVEQVEQSNSLALS